MRAPDCSAVVISLHLIYALSLLLIYVQNVVSNDSAIIIAFETWRRMKSWQVFRYIGL